MKNQRFFTRVVKDETDQTKLMDDFTSCFSCWQIINSSLDLSTKRFEQLQNEATGLISKVASGEASYFSAHANWCTLISPKPPLSFNECDLLRASVFSAYQGWIGAINASVAYKGRFELVQKDVIDLSQLQKSLLLITAIHAQQLSTASKSATEEVSSPPISLLA